VGWWGGGDGIVVMMVMMVMMVWMGWDGGDEMVDTGHIIRRTCLDLGMHVHCLRFSYHPLLTVSEVDEDECTCLQCRCSCSGTLRGRVKMFRGCCIVSRPVA